MITFQRYKERKRVDGLDGLRAIAVLLVVMVHMHERMWTRLNGGLGAVIFFVLSGYLITMLALREEEKQGKLNLAAFYIRRSFRILPLYYFVLAVYAFLILGLKVTSYKSDGFVHYLPYYLLHLQEIPYFKTDGGFPFYQTWTLGIEQKFYILWPLLAFGVLYLDKALRRTLTAAVILIFALSPVLAASTRWYELENYSYILMGALLAIVLEDRAGFAFIQKFGDAGLASLITILVSLQCFRIQATQRSNARTACAVDFMFLLGILVTSEGRLQRFLSKPLMGFVGQLSFGIYLVHLLCLNAAEKVFPPGRGHALSAYVLTCLISIAVAYVLNRLVEKPMIHVGRILSPHRLMKPSLGAVPAC
jgi:peptidoglycan/LPS O-acetylase OafA/YrhL